LRQTLNRAVGVVSRVGLEHQAPRLDGLPVISVDFGRQALEPDRIQPSVGRNERVAQRRALGGDRIRA
jgi:hypothetical protein